MNQPSLFDATHFGGSTYEPVHDEIRLTGQLLAVYEVMADGEWRTLDGLQHAVEAKLGRRASQAALSARLRDLRKEQFGGFEVERERIDGGLFRYRLITKGLATCEKEYDTEPPQRPHGH